MGMEQQIETNMAILEKVGRMNPKLKNITELGKKELGYRKARPLFAKNGHVYCTRCNELIIEEPERQACPKCGQLYSDAVSR